MEFIATAVTALAFFFQVCDGNNFNIGLVFDNSYDVNDSNTKENSSFVLEDNSLPNTDRTIQFLPHSSKLETELDIKLFVKKMSENSVLNVISTEMCSDRLARALHYARIPLIRINSTEGCVIHHQELNDILEYPSVLTIEDVVHHIFRDEDMESVNIFVDALYHMEKIYQLFVEYLVDKQIPKEIYYIHENMSESFLRETIWKSQGKKMSYMNNIVLVSLPLTKRLIVHASMVEKYMSETKNMFYASRWLILTEERYSIAAELTSVLQHFDNFALIQRLQQTQSTLEKRFRETIELIQDGIRESLAFGECPKSFFNVSSCQPSSPSNKEIFTIIKKRILSQPAYRTCSVYHSYFVHSSPDVSSFMPLPMCSSNNHLRSVNLFPNEDYGLHGKHLTVSTIVSSPFVIREATNTSIKWHGMCIDMLRELSYMLNFTYLDS